MIDAIWDRAALRRMVDEVQAGSSKLPANLLAAVASVESDWNPYAHGPKTRSGVAKGLFQFTDATAKDYGVEQMDPRSSAIGARAYFEKLSDRFGGDIDLMLAGYNAGPGRVNKETGGIDPAVAENVAKYQRRVRDVMGAMGGNAKPEAVKDMPSQSTPTQPPPSLDSVVMTAKPMPSAGWGGAFVSPPENPYKPLPQKPDNYARLVNEYVAASQGIKEGALGAGGMPSRQAPYQRLTNGYAEIAQLLQMSARADEAAAQQHSTGGLDKILAALLAGAR